jgi:RNA polymerase-binding protein DksA
MAERAKGNAKSSRATKSSAAADRAASRVAGRRSDVSDSARSGGATAKARAHKTVAAAATTSAAKDRPAAAHNTTVAAGETPVQAPPRAAKSTGTETAKGATMAKAAESKTASRATGKAPAERKGSRSAAETEKIRVALTARRDELQEEYEQTLTDITELQRERLTDSAGDDQADTGTKTFEREQEITLANAILERITQVERALERLDEGSYGWCERCGNPIPVERLAAFPSATLCVSCKQLEERR